MAASLSRALLRGMLREAGSAPAAFARHGGAARSARLGARFCSSSSRGAAVPPSCSCEKELSELRRELLEVRREMFKENQELREGLKIIQHHGRISQLESIDAMVKTSYAIAGAGGAFILGMFTVLSPVAKSAWQHETIELVEKKFRLNRRTDNDDKEQSGNWTEKPPKSSSGKVAAGSDIAKEERKKGVEKLKTTSAAGAQQQCNNGVEKPKTTSPSGDSAAGPKSAED